MLEQLRLVVGLRQKFFSKLRSSQPLEPDAISNERDSKGLYNKAQQLVLFLLFLLAR